MAPKDGSAFGGVIRLMAPQDYIGIFEPKFSLAFDLPKPRIGLLGSLNGTLLGLEVEPNGAGKVIWDIENRRPLATFPVPIYNRLWKVDGKSVVMEYIWATGGVLRDLETAEPIFILTTDHQAIVNPQEGNSYSTNEMINDIHSVGNRYLVENFRHGHFSDAEHAMLFDLKTGELVVKKKDVNRVQSLDDTVIGLQKDGSYVDLLTDKKMFEAPPIPSWSSIAKSGDQYLVNCQHQVYDIKAREFIRNLPSEVPDDFDVQIIEGRPVVPAPGPTPVYYDVLLGEVAFSLPFKGSIQIHHNRYLVQAEESSDRTRIYELTFIQREIQ